MTHKTIEKTFLVTGASRGIGRAVSERLMAQGHRVVGIGRRFEQSLSALTGFTAQSLDLGRIDGLPERLSALRRETPPLSGVICNAGCGRFGSLEEFSPTQIRRLIDLNLTSQILLAREFLPALKRQGHGDLVFMGSEAALSGGRRGAVYSATKFALRGLAQSLREECAGSGVRVGIVNPGMVKSGFFDGLGFRPGDEEDCHLTPEDVAEAVWLMLSARAGASIDEINMTPHKRVIQFGRP